MDWDGRYDREDYLFGTEPAAFLRREAPRLAPGARVLAVADGEGRNSVFLAARGHPVTAFDPSAVALEKARRLALSRGVEVAFHQADADGWDWTPEAFDAVVAIFVQFAGPDLRARMLRGMVQTLKPGGLLLLHGYAPRQVDYGTGGPPQRENMYTLPMLHEALAGLEPLHVGDYDAEVDEGQGHSGRSGLIDYVARKPRL